MVTKIKIGALSLILLLVYCVPIYWLLSDTGQPKWSEAEERNLPAFPQLSFESFKSSIKRLAQGHPEESREIFFNQFLDHRYQSLFEKAVSQHFPGRSSFLYLAGFVERMQVRLAYSFLPDPAIPADLDSGLYVLNDKSMIFPGPFKYSSEITGRIDERISCFSRLIDQNPETHFYAYYIELIDYSVYHPLNDFFLESDQGRSFEYFNNNRPEDLMVTKTEYSGLEDFKNKNFRTDHHWNIYGAFAGYDTIYSMLSQNYPSISPPVEHDDLLIFPDIKFLGSRARLSLFPIAPDDFSVALLDLPQYTKIIDGNLSQEDSDEYLSGNYATSKYFNHYGLYYGYGNPSLIEYDFNNNSDRDLLIIGNSYKKAIQLMIASHYHHTYSVDLRSYQDFSFQKFIEEHPVADVLFIGDSSVIYLDEQWCPKE